MGNNDTTPLGPDSLLGEGELKADKQVVNQIPVVPLLQWVFVLHIMCCLFLYNGNLVFQMQGVLWFLVSLLWDKKGVCIAKKRDFFIKSPKCYRTRHRKNNN